MMAVGFVFVQEIWKSIRIEPVRGRENHYVYQAQAFLDGKIDIPLYMHDIAVYKDKYYVVYPPFPALLLLPFVAVFGLNTKSVLVGLGLCVLSIYWFCRILIKLKIEKRNIAWLAVAFFCGTGYWFSLYNSYGVCFFAHITAVAALLLSLNEALGRGRGILVGLFLGMAFLSRQLSIYFAFFIVVSLWNNTNYSTQKDRIINILLFCFTLGVSVSAYLIFNWLRFDNVFDTGYSYLQLAAISQCAVKGALVSVGANPTRQTSLRPVPPGAVQGGNELD